MTEKKEAGQKYTRGGGKRGVSMEVSRLLADTQFLQLHSRINLRLAAFWVRRGRGSCHRKGIPRGQGVYSREEGDKAKAIGRERANDVLFSLFPSWICSVKSSERVDAEEIPLTPSLYRLLFSSSSNTRPSWPHENFKRLKIFGPFSGSLES